MSLPTAGQLIVENITLLSPPPPSFATRYGVSITADSFARPGNTAAANAVLHFLISIIDSHMAESLFKPCFPIMDREQERDFRKVVDARLSVLERTRLLPPGSARKSVVAQAGGERFTHLIWNLSTLAVQQACIRHPAYATASRMRLVSQQSSTDTSARQRTKPRPTSTDRSRRFLSVAMLSSPQQRAKDAEEMRARIDAERMALMRTSEMAASGAATWSSEARSLRDKIGAYEAQLQALRMQLTDMGFDQNGMDIRAQTSDVSDSTSMCNMSVHSQGEQPSALVTPSTSAENIVHLNTSPIESIESCSSADDSLDRVPRCSDFSDDLSRLLAFDASTRGIRSEVDAALDPKHPVVGPEAISASQADDLVQLVRAAAEELDLASTRMHQICNMRNQMLAEPVISSVASETTIDENEAKPPVDDQLEAIVRESMPAPSTSSLSESVANALNSHSAVVESSKSLQKEAEKLSEEMKENSAPQEVVFDAPVEEGSNVLGNAVCKPMWFVEAITNKDSPTKALGKVSPRMIAASEKADVNQTAADFGVVKKALESASAAMSSSHVGASEGRSKHSATRSVDSLSLTSDSLLSPSSVQEESHPLRISASMDSAPKIPPRSVRFAALPPSYSASRSFDVSSNTLPSGSSSAGRTRKSTTDESKATEEGSHCGDRKTGISTSSRSSARKREGRHRRGERELSDLCAYGKDSRRAKQATMVRPLDRRDVPVSSQRPPRLQRGDTSRRVMRRKEALHRSVATHSATRLTNTRELSKPGNSLSNHQKNPIKEVGLTTTNPRDLQPMRSEPTVSSIIQIADVKREDSGESSSQSSSSESSNEVAKDLAETQNPQGKSSDESRQPIPEETRSLCGERYQTVGMPVTTPRQRSRDNIEAGNSDNRGGKKGPGLFGKRFPLLKRSKLNALQSFKAARGNLVSPASSTSSESNAPARDEQSSPGSDKAPSLAPSRLKSESAFPLSESPKADGFLAGQSADWKQNLQAQTETEETNTIQLTSSSETTTDPKVKAEPGASKSSRIHSFRARLAALK